ncbi:hypothetical protein BIFGAL_03690 [Bifidobacterium gallicum DSM 20093 = LMG 11596]|nr:TilS substrate-binding domain-containing protein [Bifidobacterium gallicum]EFA22663.1 hypothetical protein BIFGAL_03690 [Bifidobacterium gallicum DSM 20093 = LMG 11596]
MVSRLASFAAANRDDVDFLQEQAALVYEQAVSFGAQSVDNADGISDVATDSGTTLALIDRDVLLEAHPALRRRVLARVFAQLNIRASAVHVTAALNLIENQQSRGVQLPAGYVLKRYGHVIRLCHDNVHANRGYSGKHRS